MDLRETYNRIAEDWHKDHGPDTWWFEGTKKFLEFLPENGTVLDVGCGSGTKSGFIARHGFRVTGIDFSEGLIAIATRENPEISFSVADMQHVEHIKERFDGLFMQAALLHIPKDEALTTLRGLLPLLKEGGFFYVAVKGVREDRDEETVLKESDYGYEYERFFSYYRLEELQDYYAQLGLTPVYEHAEVVGTTEWIQIIGKK